MRWLLLLPLLLIGCKKPEKNPKMKEVYQTVVGASSSIPWEVREEAEAQYEIEKLRRELASTRASGAVAVLSQDLQRATAKKDEKEKEVAGLFKKAEAALESTAWVLSSGDWEGPSKHHFARERGRESKRIDALREWRSDLLRFARHAGVSDDPSAREAYQEEMFNEPSGAAE